MRCKDHYFNVLVFFCPQMSRNWSDIKSHLVFFLKLQRGIFGSAREGVILVSRIKKKQPYKKNYTIYAIHAVHSAFSSLSCDKADLLRWWWWLWPWSERRPLWSCTLPQRQSKWSQTEVHQWWPPAKIEKPQSQRLKGLSGLEQCRHTGQQKQIKKEIEKKQKTKKTSHKSSHPSL